MRFMFIEVLEEVMLIHKKEEGRVMLDIGKEVVDPKIFSIYSDKGIQDND